MKTPVSVALATASFCAVVVSTTNAQTSSTSAEDGVLAVDEIIVTARRRDESLQDVPQTVNAVTADAIEKLNLLKFEDIQSVVPGLTLGNNNNAATGAAASMRGVSFEARTQTSATVEFYLNDSPVEANTMFQSMFDVGQIEVLRGPQGTLRGRASPSGAITVTTRKPDVGEIGGYAMASGTDRNGYNAQGALNLPVVADVLALRVAGLYEDNEYDGVRSVHNSIDPRSETKAGRLSLAFQPSDSVTANMSYQYLQRDLGYYVPVAGPGSSGQTGGPVIVGGRARFPYPFNSTLPANYNGPALDSGDRRSVQNEPNPVLQKSHIINAAVDWRLAGQRLSYVGGYTKNMLDSSTTLDAGNVITGSEIYRATSSDFIQRSHELRLASEERVLGVFDYTAGVFYSKFSSSPTTSTSIATFLSGAFGSPAAAANPDILDMRYVAQTLIDRDTAIEEKSAFASLTWHITDRTELTVGGRYIISKIDAFTAITFGPSLFATPLVAITPAQTACAGGSVPSTYPGFGDLPGGCVSPSLAERDLAPIVENSEDKPFVYNVQLSHRFTDGFMAYANVGSSWRRGVGVLGIFNVDNDPLIADLTTHGPEKSLSYELGFKAAFLDDRARVNLALYHQDFKGLIFKGTQSIQYLANQGAGLVPTFFEFINSADAVVDGVELDAALQITPHWYVSLAASYADGHVDDDLVPCNDPSVTLTSTQRVAMCRSNETISAAPQWNASLQSEYSMPIMDSMDAYIRGLYVYYPKNDQQQFFQADSYGLLNMYLGVRSPDNAWDVALYAKNVTDTQETLALDNSLGLFQAQTVFANGYFPQPGYLPTRDTPRRELGLQVRYAFGSR